MISTRHWVAALVLALTIHALAFMPSLSLFEQSSAEDKGETGIEIDLGMLGEMGESIDSSVDDTEELEESVAPEPEEVIEPVEDIVEDVKEAELEPVEDIIKPLQKLEKIVETKKDKVKIKKQAKPKKKKEKPVEIEEVVEEKKVVKEVTDKPSNKTAEKAASPKKRTTGRSDALSTGGSAAAERSYYSELAARLAKHKRYPSRARKRNQEGVVTLFFIVNREGKVLESRISKSSGHKRLDEAVLKMLRKASPFPPFSEDMQQQQLSINIPIEFKLKDRR
ncbi:MAG: energy transducer TonB [Gammaproteobacteria bacterium]|nr:MAG: energy transducer TonB [Gammaproteobacteria bacterium]